MLDAFIIRSVFFIIGLIIGMIYGVYCIIILAKKNGPRSIALFNELMESMGQDLRIDE